MPTSLEGFNSGTRVGVISTVTPTISNGSVYASGDQIGTVMTFTGCAKLNGGTGRITAVTALDKDKQSASIELHLWSSVVPTVTSTDNGVADITDANQVTAFPGYLGCVILSSWQTWSGNALASVSCGLDYKCASGATDITGVAIVRGTPTYTSTSGLIFGICTAQD